MPASPPEPSSRWLTRPEDLTAHLFFAAAEIGDATVEVGGNAVPVSLTVPRPENRTFGIRVHGTTPPPKPGTVVQVSYSRGPSQYRYLTTVKEIRATGEWCLEFPRAIERNEQRMATRHAGRELAGFRLGVLSPNGTLCDCELVDLATGGLAFSFRRSELAPKLGDVFAAHLVPPSRRPIPVLVEVRNIRRAEMPKPVAGCRFAGITPSDQHDLAKLLAHQR